MVQLGAITGNIERPSASRQPGQVNPVHDLNVPYEGPTEEYETPTAEMLFPPVTTLFHYLLLKLFTLFPVGSQIMFAIILILIIVSRRHHCKPQVRLHCRVWSRGCTTSPQVPQITHLHLSVT